MPEVFNNSSEFHAYLITICSVFSRGFEVPKIFDLNVKKSQARVAFTKLLRENFSESSLGHVSEVKDYFDSIKRNLPANMNVDLIFEDFASEDFTESDDEEDPDEEDPDFYSPEPEKLAKQVKNNSKFKTLIFALKGKQVNFESGGYCHLPSIPRFIEYFLFFLKPNTSSEHINFTQLGFPPPVYPQRSAASAPRVEPLLPTASLPQVASPACPDDSAKLAAIASLAREIHSQTRLPDSQAIAKTIVEASREKRGMVISKGVSHSDLRHTLVISKLDGGMEVFVKSPANLNKGHNLEFVKNGSFKVIKTDGWRLVVYLDFLGNLQSAMRIILFNRPANFLDSAKTRLNKEKLDRQTKNRLLLEARESLEKDDFNFDIVDSKLPSEYVLVWSKSAGDDLINFFGTKNYDRLSPELFFKGIVSYAESLCFVLQNKKLIPTDLKPANTGLQFIESPLDLKLAVFDCYTQAISYSPFKLDIVDILFTCLEWFGEYGGLEEKYKSILRLQFVFELANMLGMFLYSGVSAGSSFESGRDFIIYPNEHPGFEAIYSYIIEKANAPFEFNDTRFKSVIYGIVQSLSVSPKLPQNHASKKVLEQVFLTANFSIYKQFNMVLSLGKTS